jgi:hypothetical protein
MVQRAPLRLVTALTNPRVLTAENESLRRRRQRQSSRLGRVIPPPVEGHRVPPSGWHHRSAKYPPTLEPAFRRPPAGTIAEYAQVLRSEAAPDTRHVRTAHCVQTPSDGTKPRVRSGPARISPSRRSTPPNNPHGLPAWTRLEDQADDPSPLEVHSDGAHLFHRSSGFPHRAVHHPALHAHPIHCRGADTVPDARCLATAPERLAQTKVETVNRGP